MWFVVFVLSMALALVLCPVSSNPLGSVHTGDQPTGGLIREWVGPSSIGLLCLLALRTHMASVADVLLMESLPGLPGYHPGLP